MSALETVRSLYNTYFFEQIALTLALYQTGIKPRLLSLRYNYPNQRGFDIAFPEELSEIRFLHFLRTDVVNRENDFVSWAKMRKLSNRKDLNGIKRGVSQPDSAVDAPDAGIDLQLSERIGNIKENWLQGESVSQSPNQRLLEEPGKFSDVLVVHTTHEGDEMEVCQGLSTASQVFDESSEAGWPTPATASTTHRLGSNTQTALGLRQFDDLQRNAAFSGSGRPPSPRHSSSTKSEHLDVSSSSARTALAIRPTSARSTALWAAATSQSRRPSASLRPKRALQSPFCVWSARLQKRRRERRSQGSSAGPGCR